MDEKDTEAPFAREPWQRLLQDDAGGPPETTDARIRARARRDLAPRGHRWWLPASLAASFVLAVFIVQSEFGTIRQQARVVTDLPGGAMDARFVERGQDRESSEPGRSATAPAAAPAVEAPAEPEPDPYGSADAAFAPDAAGAGPRIGGPEHELKASSEIPEEAIEEVEPDARRMPEARADSTRPAAPMTADDVSRQAIRDEATRGVALGAAAHTLTPEAWYAAIEKLRAEGKAEEADRELKRLEKAHPGWVARHLKAREKAR
jgi:hypothetical protein